MSFYGCAFSYNGIHSSQFNLMIYDFGSVKNEESPKFTSAPEIVEDRMPNKYKSYYYGSKQNDPLKIKLVFGLNTDLIDEGKHLDRYDINEIATWLTSSDGYQWLAIDQPDMEIVRYKCIVSDLSLVEDGSYPYAFSCELQCDSPFAYLAPETFTITSASSNDFTECHVFCKSSFNGYYYPRITIEPTGIYFNSDILIVNETDGDRETEFPYEIDGVQNSGIPQSIKKIEIDNDRCIITTYNSSGLEDLDLYGRFNYNFFRLKRGDNIIKVKGNFNMTITCEFPVNFGG